MPNYSAGRIYKLVSDVSDEVYVGSTTQALSQRLAGHRVNAKKNQLPCHSHFNEVGWDTVHIVLVEDFPCERREQLLARERHWMEQIGTLNKRRPVVAKDEEREERRARQRAYYAANREACLAYTHEYNAANREALNARQREYHAKKRAAAAKPPATLDAIA